MEEKFNVSDDIEKTSKLPVPIIMFLVVFILVILFILITYIKSAKSSMLGYDYGFFVVIGLFSLFPIGMCYLIYKTMKSSKSMKKHIENGTIIVKKPLITKFEYYSDSDVDGHHTESGYIVLASDGMDTYRSKLLERAVLTGGYYNEPIDKEFLQKNGIPYSPKDPNYNKEAVVKRIKEIDEEIDILKEQERYMSFFAKIKNKSKISKLKIEKNSLFPPSLICGGKNLYIGDEITVLVDPDNPKNYEMEI